MAKIHIGVSACLLGSLVRYNGQHKWDRFVEQQLGEHFKLVSFCPEVGIGMGVPRKPIRLVQKDNGVRAVQTDNSDLDFTDDLSDWLSSNHDKAAKLSGFILKSKSPSCGMERVKLYDGKGASNQGVGIFAESLMRTFPNLPVEEDGRLHDHVLRENFLERVFVYDRWQQLNEKGVTKKSLLDFHQSHKFQLMAHSQAKYKELGKMLSNLKGRLSRPFCDEYISELMQAFKIKANRRSHSNVLLHLLGYLKKTLDSTDKEAVLGAIERYRKGHEPLIVPVSLLKYFFLKHPSEYVKSQYYLEPHPVELALRNQL